MDRPDDTPGGDDPVFDSLWNAHRQRMLDLGFSMLLDRSDAEDVVQEAFTRLARTDLTGIDDPEAWLVVVTSRLCVDRLRGRQRRPTDALDAVADLLDAHTPDPAGHVTLADNVTLAMHALLERLSPAERTSFVLHDVFQYPFEEVATIVGRSAPACRQLASRARRSLQVEAASGRFPVDPALQRRLGERFIDACTGGDLDALLGLLDPSVEGAGDTVPAVLVGADVVAPGILHYLGPPASPSLLQLPVGDRIGVVAMRDRQVLALVLLTIGHGLIVHIDALAGRAPRAAVSAVLGLR
ncbi:MAG: sigma-70 family RNA polymerase sigma factor [Actinomycetota bacterium]|nr:sigma-70 family RNA polymerase sigma factor [Actinomycetota bacterium]